LVALPSAYSGETMTPDSFEGRERIARMEIQIDSNRRQIEMLGALPLQVGVIQERLDSLRAQLHEAERERDERLDRHERKVDEALERMATSFSNQIASCSDRIAQATEAQQKWQDEELKRRESAATETKKDKSSDKMSRRAMWGLIGAAAVTGLLGLITQLITALS
jgi:septal ring factor EnvC (AmiA/AmiB activator)